MFTFTAHSAVAITELRDLVLNHDAAIKSTNEMGAEIRSVRALIKDEIGVHFSQKRRKASMFSVQQNGEHSIAKIGSGDGWIGKKGVLHFDPATEVTLPKSGGIVLVPDALIKHYSQVFQALLVRKNLVKNADTVTEKTQDPFLQGYKKFVAALMKKSDMDSLASVISEGENVVVIDTKSPHEGILCRGKVTEVSLNGHLMIEWARWTQKPGWNEALKGITASFKNWIVCDYTCQIS